MKTVSKIVGAALDGVAGGLALAFILCVAVSVIAISTGSRRPCRDFSPRLGEPKTGRWPWNSSRTSPEWSWS
ncbi:hypothetical protein AHiyo8_54320 [Arthrobacter sp. Hiyo8]|nr:hypothetical protein AHiyo8_54320 [Arthrobacter sp. Hiyo8]